MSKNATMSIAEDFTIKGVRMLCNEGLIDEATRKQIKAAVLARAKLRNNIDPDTKVGYEGNSDALAYLVIYDKESGAVLPQGEDESNNEVAREPTTTQEQLRPMREKVDALKTSMSRLGL